MSERNVAPGELITHQGDDLDKFYIIESGTYDMYVAKLLVDTDESQSEEKVMRFDGNGSFGEAALIHNQPWRARLVC